ncbi:MAG: DUF6069 family protein [Chloroflexaceae bacterium]
MTESTYPIVRERTTVGRLWWASLSAFLIAIAGNFMVRMFTISVASIPAEFAPFQIPRIAVFTLVGVVGATLIFAALVRFTRQPIRLFWIISVIFLLISFIPNIAMFFTNIVPGETPAGIISLMLMHVITAAAAVVVLTRSVQPHHTE